MPFRSHLFRRFRSSFWLGGVSALALLTAPPVQAGDILRGNSAASPTATATSAQTAAQTAAASAQAQAALAMARAQDALAVIAAAQSSARASALAAVSTVPNGLTTGGLEVADGVATDSSLWQNAELPVETEGSDGRTKVTVTQTDEKAILTWKTFNVGRETDLTFDQSAGGDDASSWIVLNRVEDPSASPSQILGTISAEGQVYIVNTNGIVFGGSSQVNVSTLVASSLYLSNAQFLAGIGTKIAVGSAYAGETPTFGEHPNNSDFDTSYTAGDVTVEAGAQITTESEGLVALIGTNVTNHGTITTPEGQTLLAAGENVWLQASYEGETYIGLEAYVSARPASASDWSNIKLYNNITNLVSRIEEVGMYAINDGVITASGGNISMVGSHVYQNGALLAITTLDQNGSIVLSANDAYRYNYFVGYGTSRGGELVLGEGSITAVQVDDSGETGSGGVDGGGSYILLTAATITVGEDSLVQAQAGTIYFTTDLTMTSTAYSDYYNGNTTPDDGTSILIESGAIIDVSGVSGVAVAMETNSIEITVTSNELADAALQQDGILLGETVYIDKRVTGTRDDGTTWYGSELLNADEYIENVETSIAQRSTSGGSIIMQSAEIVVESGATLNISGGYIQYLAGWVTTTQLTGSDGQVYDIGVASADMTYVSVGSAYSTTSSRWDVTTTYNTPISRTGGYYEEAYVEGSDAGSIMLYAPTIVMDGTIAADVVVGKYQTDEGVSGGSLIVGAVTGTMASFNVEDIVITNTIDVMDDAYEIGDAISDDRQNTLYLNADMLSESGLTNIELYGNGSFTLAADANLELDPGASLTYISSSSGSSAAIDGTYRSAGGSISIDVSGTIALGTTAVVDLSGTWANDYLTQTVSLASQDGGSVSLIADGMTFAEGSLIDVSAGAKMTTDGDVETGSAGSIYLSADELDLSQATLQGYGVSAYGDLYAAAGGTLQIYTSGIAIVSGGDGSVVDGVTRIDPSYFSANGFSTYVLSGDTLTIEDGITVAPAAETVVLDSSFASQVSGTDIAAFSSLQTYAEAQRTGTSLTLSSDGAVDVSADTSFDMGIGGSLLITAANLDFAGSVTAPAGSIALSADTLTLERTAKLLAQGATRILTDENGLRYGEVLDGGTVTITGRDQLVMAAGSLIDVSGTSGTIDVLSGSGLVNSATALTLYSDGGTIAISGGYTDGDSTIDATLLGNSGGGTAAGGMLTISDLGASTTTSTLVSSYIGYFKYVGKGGKYVYDAETGEYYADSVNGTYNFVGNTYSSVDLDIYDEYGTAAVKLSSTERTQINKTPNVSAGGMVVTSGAATDYDASASLTPWEYNSAVPEQETTLLNAYFYTATKSGSTYTPGTKINIADIETNYLVVSQASLTGGGFATINLKSSNGLSLDDGVDIYLPTTIISISTPYITTAEIGANAQIEALKLTLDGVGSVTAAATELAGTLSLTAQDIHLTDDTVVNGFSETDLTATNIIFDGDADNPVTLTVDGSLVMTAVQVYPATETEATVTAAGDITIAQLDGTAALPMSAAGVLTLNATNIIQGGTLRAPFGQIVLNASDTLTLAAGSITSVSGDGLTVLYGYILDEDLWYSNEDDSDPLSTLQEKSITLSGSTVNAEDGATVDVSGGGDLIAYQFVSGSGGTNDYLTYGTDVAAIIPVSMWAATAGETIIHIDGGNGIPEGDYVVVDASYALLPGAYRIVTATDSSGSVIYDYSGSALLADGSVVVSGTSSVSGTSIASQRSQAYIVSDAETIALHGDYVVWYANDYFTSEDYIDAMSQQYAIEVTAYSRLPMDAGSLVIDTDELEWDATLEGDAEEGGRGAELEIAGDKIAVVGGTDASSYQADGYLVLDAATLSGIGAESILIGGTSTQTAEGLEVDVTATSIVVDTGANALTAAEILLASEGSIAIADGSVISASGEVSGSSGDIIITPAVAAVTNSSGTITSPASDYGAFVRVSNGDAVDLIRTNADTSQGTLTVGAASLTGNAILLEATGSTSVDAGAVLTAEVLDVTSGVISVGDLPEGTGVGGLVLSADTLAALANASSLLLRSYSTIDFYGDVVLGSTSNGEYVLESLLLDAAAITGDGDSDVTINAGTLTLTNTLGGTTTGTSGTGTLTINADTVYFGDGDKAFSGFDTVSVSAADAILGDGDGTTDFGAADVTFTAPRLSATSGASQELTTAGDFVFGGTQATDDYDTLGARLAITAASITQNGLIDVSGGTVELRATSGDVTLASGSVTKAAGASVDFYDVSEDLAGGTVSLTADVGTVTIASGATVDVSASGDGNAGTLEIFTPYSEPVIEGTITAGSGGNFSLSAATVSDFAALATLLSDAGFDGDLSFELSADEVTLSGTTTADNFTLTVNGGDILVTGTVDVSDESAGDINLAASGNITVASGGRLLADASDDEGDSGLIEISSTEGTIDLQEGSTVSATGGTDGGEIRLRFLRDDAAGTINLIGVNGTLTADSVIAEAYRAYESDSVDAVISTALADTDAFMTAYAASLEAALGKADDETFHLVPGIEIDSAGDLSLDTNLDLHSERYDGEAGILTLRAAGNLLLNASLSDGFDSADSSAEVLTDAASWSYRLIGGADLSSADVSAVLPIGEVSEDTGNIVLASGTIVRSGTGSIDMAAAYNLTLADQTSVIYTAGVKIADASLDGTYDGNSSDPVFTEAGGDIVISAGNDVETLEVSDQSIRSWLELVGQNYTSGLFVANKQTAWWVDFSNFQMGIAALGGGNVSVSAGRDIVETSVSIPTQGRVGGGRTTGEEKVAVITGGGDLVVSAGRDIIGGSYYVESGTGTITAGGDIASGRTITFTSSGVSVTEAVNTILALGDAQMTVTAGGDIDLAAVTNPLAWNDGIVTYGDDSEITLTAIGGDVTLWNQVATIAAAYSDVASVSSASNEAYGFIPYYPSVTKVVAASGDINILGGMLVFPSATGNLDLLAMDSVNLTLTTEYGVYSGYSYTSLLALGSTDPSYFNNMYLPTLDGQKYNSWYGAPGAGYTASTLDLVLHEDDDNPSHIYAVNGDIVVGNPSDTKKSTPLVYLGEQSYIRAGDDILNLNTRIQNSADNNLTVIEAGGDITLADGGITIDGPGYVLVEAGEDIYLGSGSGINIVGNGKVTTEYALYSETTYDNEALPEEGADLLVLTGTKDDPEYEAFAEAYLDPDNIAAMASYLVEGGEPIYLDELIAFMEQVTGQESMTGLEAYTALMSDKYADYRKIFLNQVMLAELKAAGRGELDGADYGYERGYEAISVLYPGAEDKETDKWSGDLVMDVSRIRSTNGGDVSIVVPNGYLQVSKLSSTATGETNGILTLNGGTISILSHDSTVINTSRIITARGGDILIWSSYGDIDAGKGKRSTLTSPARSYEIDADGNITYTANPDLTGSGISTQKSTVDAEASDVDLYAPSGIINAGEAGIWVTGDIYLGALSILNTQNIDAAGDIKGLPPASVGTIALQTDEAGQKASETIRRATAPATSTELPSLITVEVIGYGEEDNKAEDEERRRRK